MINDAPARCRKLERLFRLIDRLYRLRRADGRSVQSLLTRTSRLSALYRSLREVELSLPL
jgi:hypothetical protein